VLGAGAAAVSLFGFLDDRFWVAELASSIRALLFLGSLALLVAALFVRSVAGIVLALVALTANAVVLVPLYTDEPASPSGADRLLVAHVNMQHHYSDFVDVRRTLAERRPDVFVILEPSRGWLNKPPPNPPGYRVVVRGARPEPRILLFAGERVSNVVFPEDPALPKSSIAFEVQLDDTLVHVLALHTAAPTTPGAGRARDDELAAASSWARRQANPVVVLGDLNSTPWSSALKSLEDSANLRNSAYGYGVQATWPSRAGPLGIPIDQLLHSQDLTATDRATGWGFGSEHRSLWVTIARSESGVDRDSEAARAPRS
jgi:endonuclease/exonuclease/phosphatase (EEP) superfamily protein YafD